MFYGEYSHSIDKKGRLIIPAKFREAAESHYIDTFFITRGLDTCLFLFTEEEWKIQEYKFKNISFTKKEARKFNRLYFSGASKAVCDKQGRILIPVYLQEFACIKKEVKVIGVSNRIEIWDKGKWKEFYESSRESFEEIAENIITQEES
jgi:MraZ protein